MQPRSFPAADVQAAADRCRSVATLVDERMGTAPTAAGEAAAAWTGACADDFGITWPDTELSASELSGRPRPLAGELEGAIVAAAAENQRRAQRRVDWDRQHAGRGGPC